jgi:hypothetical protein
MDKIDLLKLYRYKSFWNWIRASMPLSETSIRRRCYCFGTVNVVGSTVLCHQSYQFVVTSRKILKSDVCEVNFLRYDSNTINEIQYGCKMEHSHQ